MGTMLLKLTASAFALTLTLLVSACGGPPKQAEVADDTKETGMDTAETSPDTKPVEPGQVTEAAEKMHEKCCEQCKGGLAKDRTGAAPSTIPCADFTADLDPFCIEHFRGKPTMADQCK